MSDRIAVMSDGVVQQLGEPEEVYEHPIKAFVAGFIGISNLLPGDGRGRRRAALDRRARARAASRTACADGRAGAALGAAGEAARRRARGRAWRRVEGTIAERVYMGTATQLIVELAPGARLVALEQNTRARALGRPLGAGRPRARRLAPRARAGAALMARRARPRRRPGRPGGGARPRRGRRGRAGARGARPARRARRAGSCSTTAACVQLRRRAGGRVPHGLPRAGGGARAGARAELRRRAAALTSWDLPRAPGRASGRRSSRAADVADAERIEAALRARSPRPSTRPTRGAIRTPPRWTRSRSPAGCARRARARRCCGCTSSAALAMAGGSRSGRSLLGQLRMVSAAGAGGDLRLRALGGAAAARGQRGARRCGWPTSWARGCGSARA